METLKKNKITIITIILLALGFWVYSNYLKPDDSVPTDVSAQAVGSDVLALSQSLQSVTLDQTLFSSPLYRNLVDFSPTLPNQPVGRVNPFAPIGQD